MGAEGQNRSCSNKCAAKPEKFQPQEMCFFLTSTFIELLRPYPTLEAEGRSEESFRVAAIQKLIAAVNTTMLLRPGLSP